MSFFADDFFLCLNHISTEGRIGAHRSRESVLLSSLFHGLAGNIGLCALHVTRHSALTRLASRKNGDCKR